MAVKTYSLAKDGNIKLSAHFSPKEFRCKDGSDKILIESGLIPALERVFTGLGCSKITIVSGYRTPAHDKRVGGRGAGNHCEGKAVDFIAYGEGGKIIPSARVALYLEDMGILGIGYRCGGSVNSTHMDVNYRTKKWYGDEKISMSKSIWDINPGCYSYYDYLGIKKTESNTKPVATPVQPVSQILYNGVITCASLNTRSGAGTKYSITGEFSKGDKVSIIEEDSTKTWGKTASGWISLKYVRKV